MHIIVRASEAQKQEFLSKYLPEAIQLTWYGEDDLIEEANADVYFDLLYDKEHTGANLFVKGKLVFANAVITTTTDIKYSNYVRINAWPGFLSRSSVELAAVDVEAKRKAEEVFTLLGWKFTWSPDTPGMMAARILAMIINEAYYGLEDEISSKEEIDMAMKLGTNYPYGPFEWAGKIGLKNIYQLLKKLEQQDNRYKVAALLEKETL